MALKAEPTRDELRKIYTKAVERGDDEIARLALSVMQGVASGMPDLLAIVPATYLKG